MPGFLRQSTASQSRIIGPFHDDTDFKTPETGLTIANTDIKLMVNGGSSADKNSGGGTHRVNGMYSVTFDATDTATVGTLDVSVVVSGALPVFDRFTVLEEAVYDALFAASAPGYVANAPVNVAQISGDSTAADNCEAFFDGTGYAGTNNVIPTVTNLTNLPTIPNNWITAAGINTGAITAAKFAAGAIDAAAVADTAWQELIELCFTYNATADYAGATAGSLMKEIADNAGGSSLTAADIADAVWDEAISGHAISGSTGEALSAAGGAGDPWITALPGSYTSGQAGYILGTLLDAAVSTRASASVLGAAVGASISADIAAVKTQTAAIETDTQDIQSKIGTPGDLGGGATLAANAADMAGVTFSGATDSLEALRNRGDSAWITATGFSTHSAADVWSSGTRTLTGNVTLADGHLTAAKFATGAFTAAKFASGAIDAAALATDAAQEIRDAVVGATLTELSADPGASPTLAGAIMLPYMAIRNKRDTDSSGGTDEIHNNAGTVILTATISDSGTVFTKGKYA